MPPRELPTEALDIDNPQATEADELAEADARAAAARARATRLREQAEAAAGDQDECDESATSGEEAKPVRSRRWRLRRPGRPSRKALAVAAGGLVICAALAASGYVVWHHRDVVQQNQRRAEFATAARNAITTMLSIDPNKARDDMQRFADNTTGQFKASVLLGAEDLVKAVEQSKVKTTGTVQAVAVQSMTKDSAFVLVAAKSELIKPDKAKPETRSWRIVVNVESDGGQLKISKIEFVP